MKINRLLFFAIFLTFRLADLQAENVLIRLATVAGKDTPWHTILQAMGEKWKQASGAQVQLKIFPGTLGDESDIMRRIRIGQLDAAAVTTAGMGTIDLATQALHIPLAITSYEELDFVQSRIAGRLEKVLQDKGFVVLNWGDAGWVHFFTKSPVSRPEDLKKLKLFVWATGSPVDDIWKDQGFQPVPLSAIDILPALQTGMISAIQAPPLAVLPAQWFTFTKYMTDLKWAPLTGATIVTKTAWAKIPPQLQGKLVQIAKESGDQLRDRIRKLEQEALQIMVKNGLKIVPVSADATKEWQKLAEAVYPRIRKDMIPAEYFDEVLRLRNEFRSPKPIAKTTNH